MSSLVAEKRYKSAKTAVFWDMEDCQIPDDLNVVEVSRNIRKVLKKLNYEAKASIYAYGDTDQIKAGLKSTGCVVKQHADVDAGDEVEISKREIDYRGTAAIYADETNQIQDEDLDIGFNLGS
ncbi:NYN domain limkain-b1-type [Arabidopsis thaliana x Arabidopsis arenosa]|uniref:NYN domain limkain-b1-type n=2 Tax=Arabidopsis TaxID=3701 RepID=A0A8T2A086_ARASU|nr:NYN domain limkain-b1-type [Arabidopsis thaliana x Arabidopsis arenosa]KAG7565951.1 NYN domain limkain-b1-type [Arabidopsis suecica]